MALYDYKCSACDSTVELSKRISNRDDVESDACPHCGKIGTLNRIVAAPLISYSTTTPGSYGRSVPSDFKEILSRVHSVPGARAQSSFL